MKVVRVITRLNVGGPARQVLALQKEMARLGVEETLVTGSVDEGEADLADMLGENNFLRVPSLRRPVQPRSDLRAYREISSLIRRVNPDVVHTHLSKAGLIGRLAALRRRVPVTVHTFHGHVFEAYFSNAYGRVIKTAERHLGRRTSELLAVGEGVRQDLIRLGIASADRVRVVPAGIDLSPFVDIGPPGGELRRRFGIDPDAFVVGFAGRFVPVKRIDRLVAALSEVAGTMPDAHFVICGDGPDRALLDKAMSDDLLAGRLHLVGWVADLKDFYEASDVVVLTSDNEGTPISLIEAGAAGRPAVATGVGGVADVVQDGVTGYVVPLDASAVASKVQFLARDPETRRRMGEAARERILARHSTVRLAADLVSLYESSLRTDGR